MVQPKTILCINDKYRFVEVFRGYFEERGYRVLTASTGKDSITLLKEKKVDAIVFDYDTPGMSGAAALGVIRSAPPETQVLMLSGARSAISRDVRQAAAAILMKGISVPELMRNVERFLQAQWAKN